MIQTSCPNAHLCGRRNQLRAALLGICLSVCTLVPSTAWAQKQAETQRQVIIDLKVGTTHLNASLVFWLEDSVGNYLSTVFVSRHVGIGQYPMAYQERGRWKPGPLTIEGALPVWAHRRGIRNPAGGFGPSPKTPEPDAVTGATPLSHTRLHLRIDAQKLPKFRLMFEINQSHDFNEHFPERLADWTDVQNIGQPSLVYGKLIDLSADQSRTKLLPLGHGHPTGANGELMRGLDRFDTALWLVEDISISINQ